MQGILIAIPIKFPKKHNECWFLSFFLISEGLFFSKIEKLVQEMRFGNNEKSKYQENVALFSTLQIK